MSNVFFRFKYHWPEILSPLLRWRQDWKWARALSVDGCANRVRRLRKSHSRCRRGISERKSRVTAKRPALFERARLFVKFDFSSIRCIASLIPWCAHHDARQMRCKFTPSVRLSKLRKNLRFYADRNNLTLHSESFILFYFFFFING